MKSLYLFLALSLAFSQTAQCIKALPCASISNQIKNGFNQSMSDGTLVCGIVAAVAAALIIRSFFVKPPVTTSEPYPYSITDREWPVETWPENKPIQVVTPVVEKPVEIASAPVIEKEKPQESSLERYDDSDIAHWASINSNFEQPW